MSQYSKVEQALQEVGAERHVVPWSPEAGQQGMQPSGGIGDRSRPMTDKSQELDWQVLGSRYEDAGLMLFEKRIDRLVQSRNGKV